MDQESYLAALCRAVPYHIVEAVLADPTEAALGYRDVEGSVLVADLVSFTAMCERIARGAPERLGRLSQVLDDLFTGLELDALFAYGGYIVEFGGDAVTAMFLGEDHARRCAAAALMCQQVVAKVADGALGDESRDLRLRVGLATGNIHLSVLGDMSRRFPICSGAPPHQAILLQQRAAPGEIVLDEATAAKLSGVAELSGDAVRGIRLLRLGETPPRVPLEPLGRRIQTQVAEKISLLEPFVAAPLARRLRSLPGGWRIDAEIRRPVILFADITGFVEERRYLQRATNMSRSLLRAFQKYDGLVLKVTTTDQGHRVLVLFGLHHPSEHDSEKAILAGLEAITRLRAYADGPTMDLGMRVGIHTGPVFFGAIGGEHKHDLTVIGDAVNATARAVAAASPFELVVTEAAFAPAREAFVASALGPIQVKGREEPLALYAVHGPAEGRAHFGQRRSQRRFTAGRARPSRILQEAADRALNGRGQILGVVGEPGSGKSHLLSGVIDEWIGRGGRAVITRCRFATRAAPLAPIRELFAAVTGSTPADSDEVRAQRLRAYLQGADLGMGIPELVSLLQPVRRPDGFDEALVDLADLHARDRLIAAILRILDRRVTATDTPLLYAIEDLHHADALTLQLAERLAALPKDRPFLLVGTWRPDPVLDCIERITDELVRLDPLDLEASTELIRHELRAGGVEPSLAEFLWRRTAGNPEYLVQTVRFLSDRLLLTLRGDTVISPPPWRNRLEDLVPPRWEHVALARLDGLNELERRVLRTASAIGTAFGEALLEQAASASLDREMVSDAIAALEAHRIFTPDPSHPRGWRFRDDATRAIAYSVIPVDERAAVHRRIADALEQTPDARLETVAAAIGHHRERAGQIHEALRWYALVARMSFRAGLDAEAQLYAEKWEALHARLPEKDPVLERHAPWMAVIRAYLLGVQGRPREALLRCLELMRAYRRTLEPAALEIARFTAARSRDALGMLKKARAGLRRVTDSQVETIAFESTLALGQIAEWLRDVPEGIRWLREAERRAGDNPFRHVRLELLRGWLELAQGRVERASGCFDEARTEAIRIEQLRLRGVAANGKGVCALLEQRFQDAHRELDEALRIARGQGNLREEASALIRKGATLLWEARYDDALAPLERAAALVREGGSEQLESELEATFGAAVALTRDLGEGLSLCRTAVERAERSGLWVPAFFGRLLLARVAQVAGRGELAGAQRQAIPEALRRGFPLAQALTSSGAIAGE